MKLRRNHSSLFSKLWLFIGLVLVSYAVQANDEDDERVQRGIKRLNAVIIQNAYNDAHWQSYRNRYIVYVDDPDENMLTAEGALPFGGKTIDVVHGRLKTLAKEKNILFYVLLCNKAFDVLDGTGDDAGQSSTTADAGASTAIARVRETRMSMMQRIYESSLAKSLQNGKSAFLAIVPVELVSVAKKGEHDKLKWVYRRYIQCGFEFSRLHEIVSSDKYGSNNGNLKKYVDDPDGALTSHVDMYMTVMQNYNKEVLELAKNLSGFALRYYEYYGKSLVGEEKEYLLRLCLLFQEMGVDVTEAYKDEINDEELAEIARSVHNGILTKVRTATFKETYEKFNTKYTAFLKYVTTLEVQKNGDEVVAVLSGFNDAEMAKMTENARINALKYLYTTDLNGGTLYDGGEEFVLHMIKATPKEQVLGLLNKLQTEEIIIQEGGKSVKKAIIYKLMDNFDDWGYNEGENYKALVYAFKDLIMKSDAALKKYSTLQDGERADDRIVYWKTKPFLRTKCGTFNAGDHIYQFTQRNSGKVNIRRSIVVPDQDDAKYASGTTPDDEYSCARRFNDHEVGPFDLVVFVDVKQNALVSIDANPQDRYVPAIFLRHIQDQQFKEDVVNAASLVLDVAMLATGVGALTSAVRAGRWALAAWEFAQVAGDAASIALNFTDNEKFNKVVGYYNGFLAAASVGQLYMKANGVDFAKAAETAKTDAKFASKAEAEKFAEGYMALKSDPGGTVPTAAMEQMEKTYNYLLAKGIITTAQSVADAVNKFISRCYIPKSKTLSLAAEDMADVVDEVPSALKASAKPLEVDIVKVDGVDYQFHTKVEVYHDAGRPRCAIEGGYCFPAGTPVLLASGKSQAIEKVKEGDKLATYDHTAGKKSQGFVKSIIRRTAQKLTRLVVAGAVMLATPEHPLYANGQYTPAAEVHVGDSVLTASGKFSYVGSVVTFDTVATVYNVEVERDHNYFAGTHQLLVHNSCGWKTICDAVANSKIPNSREVLNKFTTNFSNIAGNMKLSPLQRKAFYERVANLQRSADFVANFAHNEAALRRFAETPELFNIWAKFSDLKKARAWVPKSMPLMEKLVGKSDAFIEKVRKYYGKHQKPGELTVFPSTHNGTPFNAFGHPNFIAEIPEIPGFGKIMYIPGTGVNALTGKSSDFTKAHAWAAKLLNVPGQPPKFRELSTNFQVYAPDSPFAGNDGWVECVWHHHEDAKTMLPVPTMTHNRAEDLGSPHIGGAAILEYPDLHDLIGFFSSPRL